MDPSAFFALFTERERRLLMAYPEEARRLSRQLLAKMEGVYLVDVDFTKSIDEMVVAGDYDWHDPDISSKNFGVRDTTGRIITVATEFVHLDETVKTRLALDHLETNGFRPATIEETLAFGTTYPEIQLKFPIVCLDTFCTKDEHGYQHAPCLLHDGLDRILSTRPFSYKWHNNTRFLAVRKSEQ